MSDDYAYLETNRRPDGKFGSQPSPESDASLSGPAQPADGLAERIMSSRGYTEGSVATDEDGTVTISPAGSEDTYRVHQVGSAESPRWYATVEFEHEDYETGETYTESQDLTPISSSLEMTLDTVEQSARGTGGRL